MKLPDLVFFLAAALLAVVPVGAAVNTVGFLAGVVVLLCLLGLLYLREPVAWPVDGRPVGQTALLWSGVLLLSLFWSPATHTALIQFTKLTSVYLAAAAVALSPALRERRRELLGVSLLVATLLGLHGVMEVLQSKPPLPGWVDPAFHQNVSSRAASTFANPNLLATYLTLHLPLAICWCLRASGMVALAAGASSTILFAGLLLTYSRGGWVGAAASLLLLAFILRRSLMNRRTAALGLLFLAVSALAADGVVERASTLTQKKELGINQRLLLYRGEVRCIGAGSWYGHGLNSFDTVYPRFRVVGGYYPLDAHNDLLQILIELGWPGLIAFSLLLGSLFRCLLLRTGQSSLEGPGLLAGLTGFVVCSMFMGSIRYLGLLVPFWFLTGIALNGGPPDKSSRMPLAGALLLACLGLFSSTYWVATWWTDPSGLPAEGRLESVDRSLSLMNWRHDLHYQRGQELIRLRRLPEAREAFVQAEARDPAQSDHIQWQALTLAGQGDVEQAIVRMRSALKGDPLSEDYLLTLGRLHLRQGQVTEAIAALQRALLTNRQYLTINVEVYRRVFAALAVALQQAGRVEESLEIQAQARKLYGPHDHSQHP